MRIKLFLFLGILYFVILGAFVFHINPNPYTVELFGFSYTLSVTVWILLPSLIIFILALLHMSFYGFLRYIKYKNFFNDAAKFEFFISDVLLEKNPKSPFKTSEFKRAGELCLAMKKLEKIPNLNHYNEVVDLILDLKQDKIVNLKKFKLDVDNAIYILNEKNHILSDETYAYGRIKYKKELEDELDKIALEQVFKNGSLEHIKSLKIAQSKEDFMKLLKRVQDSSLQIDILYLENSLKSFVFDESEYLCVAKSCVKSFAPEQLIALFKNIGDLNSEAKRAYYFLLADFALFDELRLAIRDSKEFNDFRLVLLARENSIKIDTHKLIQ